MRAAASSLVAPLARFQVIQGAPAGPQSSLDSDNFDAIRRSYDMTQHGNILSHTKLVDAEIAGDFVERFAIVGPPDHCTARLLELAALGIERFVVVGPGFHPEIETVGPTLFAREVMPAVRTALGASQRAQRPVHSGV